MKPINLLVTVDANYLQYINTMLKSLCLTNPSQIFHLYLVHSDLNDALLEGVHAFCGEHQLKLIPLRLDDDALAEAPVNSYYSVAMYYRLLASKILPETLDRILYLDPDVLIINPLNSLYELDMGDKLFAAAAHKGLTGIAKHLNRFRLGTYDSDGYFNSGVMLLNLEEQRKRINEQDIFDYVKKNGKELILPDQDVLNALYGTEILPLDDSIYNYDARRYETYLLTSGGKKDMDWVIRNTVIIHYCGKIKPWHKDSRGKFAVLFKHYERLCELSV